MYLDEKLNYNTHIKEKLSKVYKGIGLLRNVSNKLPRQALVTIYKAFIKPHLDYGDIVYDKPDNETFINKIEKAQYDAALAITGAELHLRKNSMLNLALNLLNLGDGSGNWLVFTKFSLQYYLSIYFN